MLTPANFQLPGGLYGVTVAGSGFGTVTLQRLAPDATTYITCLTAFGAYGLLVVGGLALSVGVLGPANATAMFLAVVAVFGAGVLVGVGSLRRWRARRTPPSAR
jgi:hypothetical protein